MDTSMIEVKKLVKRFGLKTILRGLDFSVEPGEFVVELGSSSTDIRQSARFQVVP